MLGQFTPKMMLASWTTNPLSSIAHFATFSLICQFFNVLCPYKKGQDHPTNANCFAHPPPPDWMYFRPIAPGRQLASGGLAPAVGLRVLRRNTTSSSRPLIIPAVA